MDTKEAGNKLQLGYHAIIDGIEIFLKKEGTTLKQAIERAEETIEEWEDLTADQYKRIKDEVRYDLHILGHSLGDAKKSFKHRLEMDTQFMKKSVSKKLSSIADKTTHELIEIKDSLLNNVDDVDDIDGVAPDEKIQAEHFDHTK